MRIVLGISAIALELLATTAARARPSGYEPLPATERATVEARVSSDLRIRADVVTTTMRVDPFGDPERPMRHRFASSMIDYFPLGGGKGLRLSAGLRFYEVQNFYGDAVRATDGLLWEPRVTGRNTGMRTGFARHTPAATIGYAGTIRNAVIGIEAGSLLGNANARVPYAFGMGRFGRGGGINPIANVVFGLRF